MTKEASTYCEECKRCNRIEYDRTYQTYTVFCQERWGNKSIYTDAVIYCKYKKLKKEKKKKC